MKIVLTPSRLALLAIVVGTGGLVGGCASDADKAPPASSAELQSFRGDPSKMPANVPGVPTNPQATKPDQAQQ